MAKSTLKKSTGDQTETTGLKTNAAFGDKDMDLLSPAEDNDSKYAPTEDVDMDSLPLDAEDGLLKLFTDGIKDLYWAENHLVKSLPKMAKAASVHALKQAIETHLEETKIHVQRLENVFELLGRNPQAKKCDAMEGLTIEGEGVIETTDAGTAARNLGIVMASQKVEHYEIASYTGLAKLAANLGLMEAATLLSETLAEEEKTDDLLSELADGEIANMFDKDAAQQAKSGKATNAGVEEEDDAIEDTDNTSNTK